MEGGIGAVKSGAVNARVEIESREAALCILRRGDAFLVAELEDAQTGMVFHRPPGGGVEPGESPEQALRRELQEELAIVVDRVEPLSSIDHVWYWKGREVRERAWLFVADAADNLQLSPTELPVLMETNGERIRTLWRPLRAQQLPVLCPQGLEEVLERIS